MRGIFAWEHSEHRPARSANGFLFTALLTLLCTAPAASAQALDPPPEAPAVEARPAPVSPGAAQPVAEGLLQAPAGAATEDVSNDAPEPGPESGPDTGISPENAPDDPIPETAGPDTGAGAGSEALATPPPPADAGETPAAGAAEVGPADAGGFFSDIAWNGFLKTATAFRFREPRSTRWISPATR